MLTINNTLSEDDPQHTLSLILPIRNSLQSILCKLETMLLVGHPQP
jgi:hypothetical protein